MRYLVTSLLILFLIPSLCFSEASRDFNNTSSSGADYIHFGDIFYSDSFTYCGWYNPDTIDAERRSILNKRNDNSNPPNDGTVEFNDGTFRGDLEAGTINIGSNAFQVNSTGQLHMGNAVFGSSSFRVDTDGTLVASGATIAGTLTINAGSIHIG